MLDPLAFDTRSHIGVPGLIDAYARATSSSRTRPAQGVLEAPAFGAFLPMLAKRLLGEDLYLPNIATWWCGQPGEAARVAEDFDALLIGPAFGATPLGLPGDRPVPGAEITGAARDTLIADMARRPQDYVGQEIVRLSTMPVVAEDALVARPFTLRVFAARGADGAWTVLPGGFARIGEHPDPRAAVMREGLWSADVCIHGSDAIAPVSLLPASTSLQVRRNPGTLPSRVADNLYWLGRYLERGEALLAAIRVLLGNSIDVDGGAAMASDTVGRLVGLIVGAGAAPHPASLAPRRPAGVRPHRDGGSGLAIGRGDERPCARDRRGIARPAVRGHDPPAGGALPHPPRHAGPRGIVAAALRRDRGAVGGAYEPDRGVAVPRSGPAGRAGGHDGARDPAVRDGGRVGGRSVDAARSRGQPDQLSPALSDRDRAGARRRSGRARSGQSARAGVSVAADRRRLRELPVLADDGMAEAQQSEGVALDALLATATAAALDADLLGDVERGWGRCPTRSPGAISCKGRNRCARAG